MASVLVLGATSDVGRHVAAEYAGLGYDLVLTARAPEDLEDLSQSLIQKYGVEVGLRALDATDLAEHQAWFSNLDPTPDGVVCLVGTLGRSRGSPQDLDDLTTIATANFTGPAALLEAAATAFEARGSGFLVGVSSVAGERGRQSNYAYGSAKAGFTAYLSGLRQRLHPSGIQVLTVKPGYIRTRMTQGMSLPSVVTAEPDEVARAIVRAQQKGRSVMYVRRIWRPIMAAVRLAPEWIFKRLRV